MATSSESSECSESTLRRRRGEAQNSEVSSEDSNQEAVNDDKPKYEKIENIPLRPGTYWLTRIVLLRAIAFIYCKFDSWIHDSSDNNHTINSYQLKCLPRYLK